MVKVKILNTDEGLPDYSVGKTFDALKFTELSGYIRYYIKIDGFGSPYIASISCEEVVEEEPTQGEIDDSTEGETKPNKNKILLVEDGSVDVDDLEEWCDEQGIKLVVYRQNSNKPEFLGC